MFNPTEWIDTGSPAEFHGTMVNTRFEIPVSSINAEPVLIATFLTDDPDYPRLEEQRFSIGTGWKIADLEGTRVERIDGRKPRIKDSSKLGRLLVSLFKSGDFQAKYEKLCANLGFEPDPTQTAFWENLTGQFERQTDEFKDASGREVSYSFYVVAEFDGWKENSTSNEQVVPKLKGMVKAVAARGGSADDFLAEAYQTFGEQIVADAELMKSIDSGEFFAQNK